MLTFLLSTRPPILGLLLLTLGEGLHGTLFGVCESIEQMETQMMEFVMSTYFCRHSGQIETRLLSWFSGLVTCGF